MAMMGKIRAMHLRDGKSISEIARLTSLSRNTIKKWLKAPQGAAAEVPAARRAEQARRRSSRRCTQALKADAHRPKHERRTARGAARRAEGAWATRAATRG